MRVRINKEAQQQGLVLPSCMIHSDDVQVLLHFQAGQQDGLLVAVELCFWHRVDLPNTKQIKTNRS